MLPWKVQYPLLGFPHLTMALNESDTDHLHLKGLSYPSGPSSWSLQVFSSYMGLGRMMKNSHFPPNLAISLPVETCF